MWFPDMSTGRGWIAVALVIFARWRPWRALAGALLFGCIESLIPRIAAAGIRVPQYFMLMTPYVVTLGVMVWTALGKQGRSAEPGALGLAYSREERRWPTESARRALQSPADRLPIHALCRLVSFIRKQGSHSLHRQKQTSWPLLQRDEAEVLVEGLGRRVLGVHDHGHCRDLGSGIETAVQRVHE